jgi:hypothetical protein
MKVVLLNGPAGCGKDTLAKLAIQRWGGVEEKFSRPLKQAYLAINPGANLEDRELKELHRQNLIALSEEYVKPIFGKSHFGNVLLARIKDKQPLLSRVGPRIFWISDSRFEEEAMPILMAYPTAIIRIERNGRGYESDSGGYLDLACLSWTVENNGQPHGMIAQLVDDGFERWLNN